MSDLFIEFYNLIDETLSECNPSGPAEKKLYASFSIEQQKRFEDYLSEYGRYETRERQRLFFCALRMGILLTAGDTRWP